MLDYSGSPEDRRLDGVFSALAHPVRRHILTRIARREHSITELAEPFAMTLEGVSQHVRRLERAGLLTRTRRGRVHHCRLDPKPLEDVRATLRELGGLWNARFDALDELLAEGEGTE